MFKHYSELVDFNSFGESVERTAKVCTDAKVVGSDKFTRNLWGLKHQTPFEHNTFTTHLDRLNDKLAEHIQNANDLEIHQPAFRVNSNGEVIGSFRAWANLRYFKSSSFDEILDSLHSYHGADKRLTFLTTTNIGIAREILRHRDFGFTERSTRYVKAHSHNPTFESEAMDNYFSNSMILLDNLKASGVKRDEYRELLPLSTETKFYMTGFRDQYNYFLNLRLGRTVHKGAVSVAKCMSLELEDWDS